MTLAASGMKKQSERGNPDDEDAGAGGGGRRRPAHAEDDDHVESTRSRNRMPRLSAGMGCHVGRSIAETRVRRAAKFCRGL